MIVLTIVAVIVIPIICKITDVLVIKNEMLWFRITLLALY